MLRGAPEICTQACSGLVFTCDAKIISGMKCQTGCTADYITISATHMNDYMMTHGYYCKAQFTQKEKSLCVRSYFCVQLGRVRMILSRIYQGISLSISPVFCHKSLP